jgi:type VI secretion system ImpA family protein
MTKERTMRTDLIQKAQGYFQSQLGIPLDALLTPIDPQQPAGKSLRANGVYSAIKEARREDDATVPMGMWARELKRADWDKVGEIAAHAIATKSKDLQLAAWLLEAQINRTGFDGIAACIVLMESLCADYWPTLYPHMAEDDREHRANVLRWVNEKLLPLVRQVPVTAGGRGEREYHWADWETATRNERLKASQGRDAAVEGITRAEFAAAMAATPTEAHLALHQQLADALEAIESFDRTLDRLWEEDAPGLNTLAGLLAQIQAIVASELYKRGVRVGAAPKAEAVDAGGGSGGAAGDGAGDGGGEEGGGDGPIRNRADAYARLAEAADYLMRIEPHSPAPYLVQRAVEWGHLNTAELYHEVFVKFGGHLSIFELLGIGEEKSG